MKSKTRITYPDYRKIREESRYFNHTISEADFNTNRPNPYRISSAASDINVYLRRKNGGRL